MAKLWEGRTAGQTDRLADDFNSSIAFDSRMLRQDIEGSMAHAAMLGQTGILPADAVEAILEGLQSILADVERRLVRLGAQTVFSCGSLFVLIPDHLESDRIVGTLAEYPELCPPERASAPRDVRTFRLYDVPVLTYKPGDFEKYEPHY